MIDKDSVLSDLSRQAYDADLTADQFRRSGNRTSAEWFEGRASGLRLAIKAVRLSDS